jgi:hypothetical protein
MMIFFLLLISNLFCEEFELGNQNFKYLYNKYGSAQPKNIPWAGSFWPYKEKGIADNFLYDLKRPNPSPSDKFDYFFGEKFATDWENRTHSCDNVSAEKKKGCESWWGHCNAWAAAAIKEAEPRSAITKRMRGKDVVLNVADQKAYLTEMYMENNSLFSGHTNKSEKTGKWIFDSKSSTGEKLIGEGLSTYDGFWDVSPKSFFLIFTNYVGIREIGVVIDRFTGNEVWNQPIAGYKMLPIRSEDIRAPETVGRKRLYPVLVRTNIFWANDNVHANSISHPFDIARASEKFQLEDFLYNDSYTGRSLAFFLYFDAPLRVSSDGRFVAHSGNIVGDGVWYHQSLEGRKYYKEFDHTHPDFIWLPTKTLSASSSGNRNPSFSPEKIDTFFSAVTCTVNQYSLTKKIRNSYTKIAKNLDEACSLAKSDCEKQKNRLQVCKIEN